MNLLPAEVGLYSLTPIMHPQKLLFYLSDLASQLPFSSLASFPRIVPTLFFFPSMLETCDRNNFYLEKLLDSLLDLYLVRISLYFKDILVAASFKKGTFLRYYRPHNDIIFVHDASTSSIFRNASSVMTSCSCLMMSYTFKPSTLRTFT